MYKIIKINHEKSYMYKILYIDYLPYIYCQYRYKYNNNLL